MKTIQTSLISMLVLLLGTAAHTNNKPEQLFSTRLEITVLNKLGNPQDSASIILYETKEDYKGDSNAVAGPKYTEEDGEVLFKDLKPQEYWVDASKGTLSNYNTGVKTDTLDKGRKNRINIIIK